MNVTFTSQISIPRHLCRAINTPHLAWRRLRQLVTSPHYMDSRPPRVVRLHDQWKKSEQAPPQTIIYLGIQIDLLPQDHVDSPLTMRGGDTFVSSDSAPARVSSGSAEFCRSHAPARQTPSYSSYSLDEHLLFGESQGRYHSSGWTHTWVYTSGAAQVNKFARCSSEQVCQVLQKMMYDNCVTQI